MYPREFPVEKAFRDLTRLEELLGMAWLEKRLDRFQKRQEEWAKRPYTIWSNPERHPLVPGLWHLREWRRQGYSVRRRNLPREALFAAEHGRYIGMLMSSSSPKERGEVSRYLSRRLRDDSPGPILFEVRIAASLLLHGHSAKWLSPIMEDSHDIEIDRPDGAVAVECKCQGLGAGRKVPNELFRRLVGEVDRVDGFSEFEYGFVIEPLDRLEAADIPKLVGFLEEFFRDKREAFCDLSLKGQYSVGARPLCPRGSRLPFTEAKRLLEEAKPKGPGGVHLALKSDAHLSESVPGTRGISPGFLICQSRVRDHVLRDLMDLAEDAADRLPTDKPGIVAVHVSEHIDWAALGDASALDYAVTKTFSSEKKRHVSLIVFSCEDQDYPMGPRYVGSLPYKVYENRHANHPLSMAFIWPKGRTRD
jgi:hypothetical protein